MREHGFVVRGRSARRYWDDAVDVINFQSFTSHQATVMGVSTFSFQLNLGVWPTFLPERREIRRDDRERPLPEEYECAFRHIVFPTVDAPRRKRSLNPFAFRPLPKPAGIWAIAEDGSNAAECAVDARSGIESQALPWFETLRTPEQMEVALERDADSPMRHYLVGFVAARTGRIGLAQSHLEAALGSGAFEHEAELLSEEIRRLAV